MELLPLNSYESKGDCVKKSNHLDRILFTFLWCQKEDEIILDNKDEFKNSEQLKKKEGGGGEEVAVKMDIIKSRHWLFFFFK